MMKLSGQYYTKIKSKENFLKRFSTIFSLNISENVYTSLITSLPIFDNFTFFISEPHMSSFANFVRFQSTAVFPFLLGK